jgi:hypothetical protein
MDKPIGVAVAIAEPENTDPKGHAQIIRLIFIKLFYYYLKCRIVMSRNNFHAARSS